MKFSLFSLSFLSLFSLFFLLSVPSCRVNLFERKATFKLRDPSSKKGNLNCFSLLSNLLTKKPNQIPTYLEDKVDLIWYPKAAKRFAFVTHYKMRIEETVYDTFMGIEEKAKFKAAYRLAQSGRGKGIFLFRVAVTAEELDHLKYFVADPSKSKRLQSCVGGVCHIMRNNTKIKIPFPFSQIPTLNVIYLALMQKMGYQRILKVEYVGKNMWRDLLTIEVFDELLVSAVSAVIIVWVATQTKKILPVIIPITEEEIPTPGLKEN